MVNGMWDTCVTTDIAYPLHSEWFESNVSSAREKLRLAYDMWKENNLSAEGDKLKQNLMTNKDFDPTVIGQNIIDFVTADDNRTSTNKQTKVNKLKKSLSLVDDLESKVEVLKDSIL